jgi:hypothetical protein
MAHALNRLRVGLFAGPCEDGHLHEPVKSENGLIIRSVTTEVTSGLRLYLGSYEFRVTRTSGFRCENIELWEKV